MEGVPHVDTEFKPSRVVYHTRMIRAGDLHGLVLERKERIDSRQDQPVICSVHACDHHELSHAPSTEIFSIPVTETKRNRGAP